MSGAVPEWFALVHHEELEGYRRWPQLQCEVASVEVVERLAEHGVAAQVVEYTREDGTTHCVVMCDGTVVDLTYGQYDSDEAWPLVEPAELYGRRHAAGPEAVDIIMRWYEAGWEVDEMRDHWARLGLLAG